MKTQSIHTHVPQLGTSVGAPKPFASRSSLYQGFAFSLFAASLCLVGCDDENPTAKIGSPAEMGTRLNASLPKGTPVQTAKDFMLKEGFSCDLRLDAKWKNKPHINYLQCKREDGVPPIKRLWEVAVIHDGTSVIVVDVRAALVYP